MYTTYIIDTHLTMGLTLICFCGLLFLFMDTRCRCGN